MKLAVRNELALTHDGPQHRPTTQELRLRQAAPFSRGCRQIGNDQVRQPFTALNDHGTARAAHKEGRFQETGN